MDEKKVLTFLRFFLFIKQFFLGFLNLNNSLKKLVSKNNKAGIDTLNYIKKLLL